MAENLHVGENVRVFVNHVDTYCGNHISKILSQSIVRGTIENNEEVDDISVHDSTLFIKEDCYHVVGTLKDKSRNKPEWVSSIIKYETKEELLFEVLKCDFIIYDIVSSPCQVEEATWTISGIHASMAEYTSQKVFICISSVLTWARTKPLDLDDPEMPFTEEDYRKRKAHPNFKSHLSCEKLVIKNGRTNKNKLLTYVIAAGLIYGMGENSFHSMFKSAWCGVEKPLPIFGNGQNIVPTIHLNDLGQVVVNLCDQKPKPKYILGVDESNTTLKEIIRSITKNLGHGRAKFVTREEALLETEISQNEFDMMTVNLRLDATFIKENMNITWVSENGLPENINKVIKEFKETRNLLPFRVCILGPPASGKSTVCEQLCKHFKIHHIKIQDVIEEAIMNLKLAASRTEGDEEEDDIQSQEMQKTLEDINDCKEKNNGRLDDEFITQFYKEKLHSMPCQNQGYILDGYPRTMEQAKQLFAASENEDSMEEDVGEFDPLIMPELLISLTSSDDFLRTRIMDLPESAVAGTHNTEEGLMRRLLEFRTLNTEDETVANYFDELEIHPEYIDVTQDLTPYMRQTVEKIIQLMGKERNYGPTPVELAEMERKGLERKLDENRRRKEEHERLEAEEARDRAKKLEEWRTRLNEVKQQEEEMLETQAIPLRNYLMKHVMPTLTQGLIECCKLRPEDPVDFLAEFLFEQNPQVNL